MSIYLRSDDVRALLKLVGEARELLSGGEHARQHVLEGLSRITGCVVSVSCSIRGLRAAVPDLVDYVDHGLTSGERARVLAYYGEGRVLEDPPCSLVRARRAPPHLTVRRADVVGNKAWYRSRLHDGLHRQSGLDDIMMSVRYHDGAADGAGCLIFKRAAGDPPFAVEDRELLHLFHTESDWIFRKDRRPPPDLADGLTRRERETLAVLLTGASEKQAAARLGVSPHTVHDYVKRLYRKLGVTSRAELMARSSAGGAPPQWKQNSVD